MKSIPQRLKAKKTLVPQLAQIREGWSKEYPPTNKKLPVVIDVPEFMAELGMGKYATEIL